MRPFVTAPAMAVLCIAMLAAQQSAAPSVVDVEKIGPQVGATVATFRLRDQDGRERSLESIMGPKGAVLVFFRSADW